MKCPSDSATLVMSERSGIEIDYCPECRGVWLDRGELDKIIDRAGAQPGTPTAQTPPVQAPPLQQPPVQQPQAPLYGQQQQQQYGQPQQQYGQQGYTQGYGQQPYRRKKKENWLSELFD